MADDNEDVSTWLAVTTHYQSDKDDDISCEIGFNILHSMSGHKNIRSTKVSTYFIGCYLTCYITSGCYIVAGAGCIDSSWETAISNNLWSSSYSQTWQRVTGLQSLEG